MPMRIDQKTLTQIKRICLEMNLPFIRVFGSSTANLKKARDLDLVIPNEPKNYSEYAELISKLETFFQKKVDLVFLDRVKNPRLIIEILSTSKALYSSKKGDALYALLADRLHGLATEEILRFPIAEQLKQMRKTSRRLHA